MGNLSNFVKRVRDIMRNDAGINGDAQRIEQIAWMLFLKVYDAKEDDWEWNEKDYQFLSASSIWCHPVISSDIWFPLCKGKIHASTNNNLKYPRFFDAFFLYSVFSVWTAQMEIGGMFRRDAGQNAPLLRHKTKGKSRIMNQNQAKEYYKKLFVNYPDVLSVEEATTLLGFKSQTAIIRRIHQHRIRCLKVGRSFMIPKEYLIDYLLDS